MHLFIIYPTPHDVGFSLEAMEQLLSNNQQLSSAAERSA